MKKYCIILLFLALAAEAVGQNKLVVHEWGTFTTLTSSNGQQYDAPLRSLEALPDFVKSQYWRFPYYDTKQFDTVFSYANHVDANMGMETPVIYFYSDDTVDFQLDVSFKNGTISQFFPQPTFTESFISPARNFSLELGGHTGYATWKGRVLEKSDPALTTYSNQQANEIWNHPREVTANMVEVDGVREKYLFYRGLGYYNCPIQVQNDLEKTVKITNMMNETLGFYACTEMVDGELLIHSYGSVEAKHCVRFSRNQNLQINIKAKMIEALIAEGLYEDEAMAMLATWNESYFESSGLKVFWIVPQKIINEILPISINPEPKDFKRAFFGRIEVMEAEFEEYLSGFSNPINLYNQYNKSDPYKARRVMLYMAYPLADKSIVNKVEPCAYGLGINGNSQPDFVAYPNPANYQLFIQVNFDQQLLTELRILDQTGREIFTWEIKDIVINEGVMHINLENTPPGMYFIQISAGEAILTKKLLIGSY